MDAVTAEQLLAQDWAEAWDLTDFQRGVLAGLITNSSRQRDGNGPWERGWVTPMSPAQSRAMAHLYRRGLIEQRYGRPSSKIPHSYRWRTKP